MKKTFSKIYFPMTADIIHPGHIKCLRWLIERCDQLVVGVLTDAALKGYKKNTVPFEDRIFVVKNLRGDFLTVPQNSLNPEENIKKYQPDAIASGDGWEKEELEVIKKYNLTIVDVDIPKEHSSTAIKKQVCKLNCL